MRRSRRPRLLAAAAVGLLTAAVVPLGAPASAQAGCADFDAIASADGVRLLGSGAGFSPTDVDGAGPAAQARVDSFGISTGYAGAPYSEAAAGNAGAANVDATKIPVFAQSSYPSAASAGQSTPAFTLESKSDQMRSSARVVGGGTTLQDPVVGRSSTTATSSCADDGTVEATSENVVEAASFAAGVLRIGSVTSDAKVVVSAAGEKTLSGAMAVEGASVLGQVVSITDQGVVAGQSPAPLPGNPLLQALSNAGISVRTISAVRDDARGEVLAPALEVTVTHDTAGIGSAPATTTYTFGRAYARAGAAPSEASSLLSSSGQVSPASRPTTRPAAAPRAPMAPSKAPAAAAPQPQQPAAAGSQRAVAAARPIANVSLASIYPVLALGVSVLAAAALLFRTLGVKLRWR